MVLHKIQEVIISIITLTVFNVLNLLLALFTKSLDLLLSSDLADQEYSLRVLINCALNGIFV